MHDSDEDSESTILMLPRRPKPTNQNAFPQKVQQMTNIYEVALEGTSEIHQYVIDVTPDVEDSSIPLLRVLGRQMVKGVKEEIGYLAHKGRMLWGRRDLSKALSDEVTFEGRQYQCVIKKTKSYYLPELNKLKPEQFKLIQHVFTVLLREMMGNLGMEETSRGRYFRRHAVGHENMLPQIGLQVLRTHTLSLIPLINGLFIQVDIGSRILQTNNFLQTLSKLSKYEYQGFIGSIVMSNYGNNRTYKVDGFDFKQNPMSHFYHKKKQGNISYLDYYKETQGITIRDKTQPLVMTTLIERTYVEGKLVKKEYPGYLIPELLKLTGIPDQILRDFHKMREIAQFTKLLPEARFQQADRMIKQVNSQKGGIVIGRPIRVRGFVMPEVTYRTYKNAERKSKDGALMIKDKVKSPQEFKEESWMLVYFRSDKRDQKMADDFVYSMQKTQDMTGIRVSAPVFCEVKAQGLNEWKKVIADFYEKDKIVVVILNQRNRQEKDMYGGLKTFLNNEIGVVSQFVWRKNVEQAKPAIITKLVHQMNAKVGGELWEIVKGHPYWKGKDIACAGIAFSKGKKGWSMGFNGTYSQDLTKTYSECLVNIKAKQDIDVKIYEEMMVDWIKCISKNNGRFPKVIILYREGLSDEQAKKQGEKQVRAMRQCIERARKKDKNYNPQFLYMIARKQIDNRFFSEEPGASTTGKFQKKIVNPQPGTVIFEDISSNGANDFHLAPQKVTQGTTTPTQFVIGYQNTEIPIDAVAQFTYEQCFNYANWAGAVRVPACLQNANKLSKLVGGEMNARVTTPEIKKLPFFL